MMGVLKKTAKGYNYTYADLASVLNYVEQELKLEVRNTIQYLDANVSKYGFVVTSTRPLGSTNGDDWSEWLAPIPILLSNLERQQNAMQAYGSAETYARRYSIQTALGLATTDDDAQTSTYHVRDGETDTKLLYEQADRLMRDFNVPSGGEDRFISEALRTPVVYGKATNTQLKRFITVCEQHKTNNNNNNVQQGANQ